MHRSTASVLGVFLRWSCYASGLAWAAEIRRRLLGCIARRRDDVQRSSAGAGHDRRPAHPILVDTGASISLLSEIHSSLNLPLKHSGRDLPCGRRCYPDWIPGAFAPARPHEAGRHRVRGRPTGSMRYPGEGGAFGADFHPVLGPRVGSRREQGRPVRPGSLPRQRGLLEPREYTDGAEYLTPCPVISTSR